MMTIDRKCKVCGCDLPVPKHRMPLWRKVLKRACRTCQSTKHGMSRTRLYREWQAMKNRCGHTQCSNPAAIKYYVERGIVVCAEWMDFPTFARWSIHKGYAENLTLDRIDSVLGYSPGNCRWVTMVKNLRDRNDRQLDMTMAREIRSRRGSSSGTALAAEYGVTRAHVYDIWAGRRWSEDIA